MFPLHIGCHRLLSTIKPDAGVQVSALIAAGVVDAIYGVFLTAWLLAGPAYHDGVDAIAAVLFVALAANAMAFFYFQFVNMTLTSIHMTVLFRIYWTGKLSLDALVAQYNDRLMVTERLQRLAQLKQIEVRDGVVYLQSQIMVTLAMPVFLWRRLLGWR
jgi:hypothetical protein